MAGLSKKTSAKARTRLWEMTQSLRLLPQWRSACLQSLTLLLASAGLPAYADTAYVSLEDENSLAVISIPDGKLIQRISVGKRPRGISADRQGKNLWVAVSEDRKSVV